MPVTNKFVTSNLIFHCNKLLHHLQIDFPYVRRWKFFGDLQPFPRLVHGSSSFTSSSLTAPDFIGSDYQRNQRYELDSS